jgi:aspartyl-tRNA(Asn)/glutamyl-tRNA(Gln) amidotransferase subunit C
MVSKEEIEHVAKLMRIEIDDHVIHIDRVQKMIAYFDILDKANVESEDLIVNEQTIDNLREDAHIPYDDNLLKYLKNYKDSYIRAPKMV